MAGELPPVVAKFIADTVEYVANIDKAIASDEALAESAAAVDEALVSVKAAMAGAGAAAADAAAAQGDLGTAAKTTADAASFEAEMMQTLADAEKVAADAAMASVDASIALARADRTAGEAAEVAAGQHTAAAAKIKEANSGAAASSGAAAGAHSKLNMAVLGLGAAAIYSTVKAASFQSEVQRLYSAAGLTGAKFDDVSKSLLKIGNDTGFAGKEIAQAMYHPVSAGLNLAQSLNTVSNAAKLAKIHGADLEDTTYALSSVMKAYNVNAKNVGQTSALLNSIVGQGDMRFQDFNQSIKNWTPTGAAMGISIQSMGAALAYLTDRGNSAEVASTRMTMGLSMVTSGSKAANTYLKDLGLTTGSLNLKNKSLQKTMEDAGLTTNRIASDLKKPDGIYVALKDIQDAFKKSGLSAAQADQVMAKIFGGGRSDKAIMSLMSNLDGLHSKYDDIGKAAGNYGASWKKTQATTTQQWHQTTAQVKNLAVSFGSTLLPAVNRGLGGINKLFGGLLGSKTTLNILKEVVPAILAVVVAIKIWTLVTTILNAVMDANPISLIIIAIGALVAIVIYAYKHFAWFRNGVQAVGHAIAAAWHVVWQKCQQAIHWFTNGPLKELQGKLKYFSNWWKQNGDEVTTVTKKVWSIVSTIISLYIHLVWDGEIKPILTLLKITWTVVWGFIKDYVKLVWDEIYGVVKFWIHLVMNTIAVILDLLTGKWGKAWKDLKKLAGDALHDAVSLIKNVTKDFGKLLWDAGKNIIKGLISGIKSMFGDVGNVMHDLTSKIGGFLPHSPAKEGPLSGSGDPLLAGQEIVNRIALGMTNAAPGVSQAATAVAAAALLPGMDILVKQPSSADRSKAKKLQHQAASDAKKAKRYGGEVDEWEARYRKYMKEAKEHPGTRYRNAARHALAEIRHYEQMERNAKAAQRKATRQANALLNPSTVHLPHMPHVNRRVAASPEYMAAQAAAASLAALRQGSAASWAAGGLGAGIGSANGTVVQHVTNVTVQGSVRSDRDLVQMIQTQLLKNRKSVALPAGR